MKKVVSILLAMIILCSLFTGCATNTPNNSTSDTSPAGNSATTNDTKTYRRSFFLSFYMKLSHGSHSTSKQP